MTGKGLPIQFVQWAIVNPLMNESCSQYHLHSCTHRAFQNFKLGSKAFFKLYSMFIFAHFLFSRRKKILNNPLHQFKKFIKSFIKSLLFGGGYLFILRAVLCLGTRLYACGQLGLFLGTNLAGASILFEPSSKWPQIALFMFTNTLNTIHLTLKRRSLNLDVPYGISILYALSLGVMCYHYFNNKQNLRSGYVSVLDKLLKNS